MKRFAFITNEGIINHILSTHIETEYTDGVSHNGYLVKDITGLDITGQYWTGSGFLALPECPGKFFKWGGSSWVFQVDEAIQEVILQRNNKLYLSDWTQMADAPLTTEQKAEWATYRQALRDLPSTITGEENSLEDITWPTQPTT